MRFTLSEFVLPISREMGNLNGKCSIEKAGGS